MMYRSLLVTVALALGSMSLSAADVPAPLRPVDFARDIQPILRRSCLSCHDARKQRGGLRLDQAEAARHGGDSGAVIKPGDAAQSRLILLVSGRVPDLKMPPTGKRPLNAKEVALLRAWIDRGAKWPATTSTDAQRVQSRHWAFQPVKQPALPIVKDRAWMRNALDGFVLARLEKEGLAPAPEADRPTLLRRLSLDLLGLPPTLEEIADFERDRRPDAYEKVVDRLLASPHYGERWGRHWLDVARFSESQGFEYDRLRDNAWRYRDYVIQSLNADK
ncbi:MAG: DUF1549 domain-containing protein, partial [Gemmataceae bacterium]